MISKWLFSGAALLEIGSWASAVSDLPVHQAALLYASAHGLGSAMLAAGIWLLLPRRYRYPFPWSPLFIFSVSFFIPLIGMIGVALALFPALYLPRKRKVQPWEATAVPNLPFKPRERKQELMFSDGGLQDVLRHARDPDQRLTAIFATRRMRSKEAIPILKLALRDPSDDVRLLAYSMLDQRESRINQRIEHALADMENVSTDRKFALHAQLARWYWELAYVGLVQGSVLDHVLQQAWGHVTSALVGNASGELHLLAGRIAMEQGNLDEAMAQFDLSAHTGMDAVQLAPYRAEIAFLRQRYEEIPQMLATMPAELLQRPPFAALARYWL
ncbi:HEAT repeat domain-containing protein [Pseudomonas sp. NY15364]|uniref:HEAT repeat domain-containing protein n=1 Tax=Pseudomonas sp. NY15364 TaxID=3400353 RepID=UPI003A867B49